MLERRQQIALQHELLNVVLVADQLQIGDASGILRDDIARPPRAGQYQDRA